jgi:hypothetical protein
LGWVVGYGNKLFWILILCTMQTLDCICTQLATCPIISLFQCMWRIFMMKGWMWLVQHEINELIIMIYQNYSLEHNSKSMFIKWRFNNKVEFGEHYYEMHMITNFLMKLMQSSSRSNFKTKRFYTMFMFVSIGCKKVTNVVRLFIVGNV